MKRILFVTILMLVFFVAQENGAQLLSKDILATIYPPREQRSLFEKNAYKAGKMHFWQMYGKDESRLSKHSYRGYIIYADPYHRAQQRISFLLGSDCSHFVHRLLQVLGLDFPYAKTRQWIDWALKYKDHNQEVILDFDSMPFTKNAR